MMSASRAHLPLVRCAAYTVHTGGVIVVCACQYKSDRPGHSGQHSNGVVTWGAPRPPKPPTPALPFRDPGAHLPATPGALALALHSSADVVDIRAIVLAELDVESRYRLDTQEEYGWFVGHGDAVQVIESASEELRTLRGRNEK